MGHGVWSAASRRSKTPPEVIRFMTRDLTRTSWISHDAINRSHRGKVSSRCTDVRDAAIIESCENATLQRGGPQHDEVDWRQDNPHRQRCH
jgi:hypothetical protein